MQETQARRNEASKPIGQAKAKKDEAGGAALMAEVAGLKDEIAQGEERERELKAALETVLAEIPNLPAADVPDGKDENDNVEVRRARFGTQPGVNDAQPAFRDRRGAGPDGFRGGGAHVGRALRRVEGGLARLERAIANFMLDLHTGTFGYTEV